jgi:hypothetical protein
LALKVVLHPIEIFPNGKFYVFYPLENILKGYKDVLKPLVIYLLASKAVLHPLEIFPKGKFYVFDPYLPQPLIIINIELIKVKVFTSTFKNY